MFSSVLDGRRHRIGSPVPRRLDRNAAGHGRDAPNAAGTARCALTARLPADCMEGFAISSSDLDARDLLERPLGRFLIPGGVRVDLQEAKAPLRCADELADVA